MKKSSAYDSSFYSASFVRDEGQQSAAVVVPLVLDLLPVQSVLDVGCGPGGWLATFLKNGVTDVRGLDSKDIPDSCLIIDPSLVTKTDLSKPFDLGRHFDIVISLEVAEHLPSSSAIGFVDSISHHTDVVLFSAAIPGQGGVNHVNEQWPSWWAAQFAKRGFTAIDLLRGELWLDETVAFWYRQNMILYSRGDSTARLQAKRVSVKTPLDIVHPAYLDSRRDQVTLRELAKGFPLAIKRLIKLAKRRWYE